MSQNTTNNSDRELITLLEKLGFSTHDNDVAVFKTMMAESKCTIDDLKRADPKQIQEMKRYYIETLEKLKRTNMPILDFLGRFGITLNDD